MTAQKANRKKLFIVILALAIIFKLSIFIFGAMRVPGSILDSDSESYLATAKTISTHGVFGAEDAVSRFKYEAFRTPGYPVFLAIFHNAMHISLNGIVFLQLLLTILAGFITYKLATEIDRRIGLLSMAIVLFDPPTAVYSLKIMTEALFLPLLALFLYLFIRYLKSGRISLALFSAFILAVCTYVRPITYYLGIAVAMFMVYANAPRGLKRASLHAFLFLAIAFSLLASWQLRNYNRSGDSSFTTIIKSNLRNHGLAAEVARDKNTGLASKGLNYLGTASGDFVNLMTLPGSLKYYDSKSFVRFSKVIFYAWMVFWMIGFLAGCVRSRRNIYLQFLLWVILYFAAVTVVNISEAAGERFRIPMVPSIAAISGYGWLVIKEYWGKVRNGKKHSCCTQ